MSGHTRDEAEVAADKEFMDGGAFDFDTIWSEFTLEISEVSPRHEVYPVHWSPDQGMICKICLKTVVWTGIAFSQGSNCRSPEDDMKMAIAGTDPYRAHSSVAQPG